MKFWIGAVLTALLMWAPATAQAGFQGRKVCTSWQRDVIVGAGMDSSQSFDIERKPTEGGAGLIIVLVELTDANSSITQLQMAATTSDDDNATDYTVQSCTTSSGACASDDAVWNQGDGSTGPGTKNWSWRVDNEGLEDMEFTFSVASGTGASADLLTVHWRECVK